MVKNIKGQPVLQDNPCLHGSAHRLLLPLITSLFVGLPVALAEPLPGNPEEANNPAEATDAAAQALLRKADQIRFPTEGFQVEISKPSVGKRI